MCLLIWKKTNQAENRKRSWSLNKCRTEPISSLFSWLLIVTQGLIVCSEQRERARRWFSLRTLRTQSSLPGVLTTAANSPFKNKFTPSSSYNEKPREEEEKRFQNRHKHFLRITHILENQEMEITIGNPPPKVSGSHCDVAVFSFVFVSLAQCWQTDWCHWESVTVIYTKEKGLSIWKLSKLVFPRIPAIWMQDSIFFKTG